MIRRALIVIDVQNEYVNGKLPIEFPDIQQSLKNIAKVMDAAHAVSIPVIVVQHTAPKDAPIFDKGSSGWQLHETVAQRPHDHYIEKHQGSAFAGTDLTAWLTMHDINTLTIVGYMTHNCDASTIYHAAHAGFEVEFLYDATGSLPYSNRAGQASAEEIHRVYSVVMQSNFAVVLTTEEWLATLPNRSTISVDSIYKSNQMARKQKLK